MSKSTVKNDVSQAEREALKLFLDSIANEFNAKFCSFSAFVDYSALLPQLHIRENGKL